MPEIPPGVLGVIGDESPVLESSSTAGKVSALPLAGSAATAPTGTRGFAGELLAIGSLEPKMDFQMPPLADLPDPFAPVGGSGLMGTTGTTGRSSAACSNFFFAGARRAFVVFARSRLWLCTPGLFELSVETLRGEASADDESASPKGE